MNIIKQERCAWAGSDLLYQAYHDNEWGVSVHNDNLLFEFLTLEGAQAGLSWITILRKRPAYRLAFANFEPAIVADFDATKASELLNNPGIVRNRLKIASTITNAQAFLKVQKEFGSFDAYLWRFVNGLPIQNSWKNIKELPCSSELSDKVSLDLKKRGFRFIGTTICYSYMQAIGMINDHTTDCFRWKELQI